MHLGQRHYKTSMRGPFGDSLSEMDGTVEAIMSTLDRAGQLNNTIVGMFHGLKAMESFIICQKEKRAFHTIKSQVVRLRWGIFFNG